MKNKVIFVTIIICLSNFACYNKYTDYGISIDALKYDTLMGYPYPANYDWNNWIRNGYYNKMREKSKYSWEPIVNFIKNKKDEIYRINFGLIKCIIYKGINSNELLVQKDSVLDWINLPIKIKPNPSISIFTNGPPKLQNDIIEKQTTIYLDKDWNNKMIPDSFVKVTHKIEISKEDWDKTIKLINRIKLFQKPNLDSTERHIENWYNWELEGIKKGKYNLITRATPSKDYENELFELGNWLIQIAGENQNKERLTSASILTRGRL